MEGITNRKLLRLLLLCYPQNIPGAKTRYGTSMSLSDRVLSGCVGVTPGFFADFAVIVVHDECLIHC